jgi:Enoyl-(Acyl carrier protein) reductase
MASVARLVGMANRAGYAAAEAGVVSLTRVLAVNAVAPGYVRTAGFDQRMGVERGRELSAAVPLGRLCRPDEVARCVLRDRTDDRGRRRHDHHRRQLNCLKTAGCRFVARASMGAPTLFDLCFQYMATAEHRLVAYGVRQCAKGGVVAVVELLDDLEGPSTGQRVQPDQILADAVGQRAEAVGSQAFDDLVELGVGTAGELVERVESPASALDALERLRHGARRRHEAVARALGSGMFSVD